MSLRSWRSFRPHTHGLLRIANDQPFITSHKPTFWYSYGTPLFNVFLWSSTTTLGLHLLWHNLNYAEIRKDREAEIKELQARIKTLQENQAK
ncbi:hypothetical protein BC943DRAFT_331463 [Umbelopsis sp. AD052]|nr:hypothetical protein BC943DRAFT_331463 [Umbelopsis sp. AD052]